jgi:hypothetical protein
MKEPFRYEFIDDLDIVHFKVTGYLNVASAAKFFETVREKILSHARPVGLLYESIAPLEYEVGAVEHAKVLMQQVDSNLTRTAVVSEKTTIRFSLSIIQLATGIEIKSFSTVASAKAWIRAARP